MIASPDDLAGYDLVVGADGVNSFVRGCHADGFGATITSLHNRFAWFGTTRGFDTLTQTFVEAPSGTFNAHHYRHAPGLSTFVVECDPATWERAGFRAMDEAATLARCAEVFAPTLEGQ